MSDPIELEENFVLTVSDQGAAEPLAHAISHLDGGTDELLLSISQVSGLGTMASQNKGTVDIEGGTIDNTPIGGTTKAAGGFTSGTFTGNVAIAGTLSVTGAVTLAVALAVNQGGTGAITDSGARANLGIGTLATQNKNLVDIEGGTIDATPIGGTTKAAGGFTTGTFTGNVTVGGTLNITGTTTGAAASFTTLTSTGGALNGTIGAGTAAAGTFTTLTSTGGALNGTIGAGTAAAGTFTTLTSTGGALNGTIGAGTAASGAFTTVTGTTGTFSGLLTANGGITLGDAQNIAFNTTTGTKIGTATTQKIGFWNATPVVQPAAIADATDAATAITQQNLILAALRTLGIIAT